MNIAALFVAGRVAWNRAKPFLVRDAILYPAIGFIGLITLWWLIASFRRELMPTPLEALTANLDYRTVPENLSIAREGDDRGLSVLR